MSNGPTPTIEEAYDPKSLEHIKAGTYPIETDMVKEMEAFIKCFKNMMSKYIDQKLSKITTKFFTRYWFCHRRCFYQSQYPS